MSKITVRTSEKRFDTAPDLYGIFFEDISHAGDGGVYPEMLRNRSFEDSLIPDDCVSEDGGKTFVSATGWLDEFNHGEGMNSWVRDNHIVPTPIPAWYPENCTLSLNTTDTLNKVRRTALQACFEMGGSVRNIGYAGVPQVDGSEYIFMCFAKSEKPVKLLLSVKEGEKVYSEASLTVESSEWKQYQVTMTSSGTTGNGSFVITAPEGGTVLFGFTSLMPAETFNGHGLRKDLVEKLKAMHPGFMRFPGGCIVEGFSKETAMKFKKTIGPVWERPSFWLLWHYRSTNGLGFHEYLQLAEDIGAEALYVCNCGMTCQGRCPYYFNDEEVDDMLQDVLDALEYALGDKTTKWGAYRAGMGHEAPFRLKYLEIGNENWGPEYIRRYQYFKKVILEKYPQLLILANTKDEELLPDIVDDHYYNMPEFYAENIGIYDSYDRAKPDIFVGEFSVNQTYEGQVRGAVAEAMFMVGFERNQDKVKLCSYAPLFENVHYGSWYPNLIIYDNYRSYVIPSHLAFSVFGKNRGDRVVESDEETATVYRAMHGYPFITGKDGTAFRNAVLNGKAAVPVRDVHGRHEAADGVVTLRFDQNEFEQENPFEQAVDLVTAVASDAGDIDLNKGTFDVEVRCDKEAPVGVGILCAPKPLSYYDRTLPVPTDPWKLFNLDPVRLVIRDGLASVERGFLHPEVLATGIPINVQDGNFHHFSCVFDEEKAVFSIDGTLVANAILPHYQSMCSVVTATDDELIVKIVNFSEDADDVTISLDCDVEDHYTADRFSGPAEAENTIEHPDTVVEEIIMCTGAGREFVYTAPGMSVNALRLKIRKN